MQTYLVAYDISDPKRLRQVAQACQDYGRRCQLSLFICRLPATEFVRLKSRLHDLINPQEDQVLLIPLCTRCETKIEALGRPSEPPTQYDSVVII